MVLAVRCQQCRIQRCNAEFVAATSPGIGLQEESEGGGGGNGGDFCIALRAYSQCTKKTAKYCRGDLVYHSAVLGINDLMAQHNCSKTGPTAPVKPSGTERSRLPELCSYQGRVNSLRDGGQQQPPKFAHCGLFGDPHLRTFRDEFQTCKVEGAWPLIDSDYLSVQVTNVPVVRDSSATATSKVNEIVLLPHTALSHTQNPPFPFPQLLFPKELNCEWVPSADLVWNLGDFLKTTLDTFFYFDFVF